MDWRSVPSLASLRAFEAVARSGSLSAAARDLNVTHAAIAQHVRALEATLKTVLLTREGRGMALTDSGAQLAAALTSGFTQIIDGVQQITTSTEARPIALSVTPNFAENWLMPRFSDFWGKHPEITLSILPSNDVVDLRREGIDMAIRYGRGDWPGLVATPLLKADFTVVGAPSLVAGRKVTSFEDLNGLPWLFDIMHKEGQRWVMESGLDLAKSPVNQVATSGMVMAAVRAGEYLTVASSSMVARDLQAGSLLALLQRQPEGLGYFIVHPPDVLSPRAKTLRSWLLSAV